MAASESYSYLCLFTPNPLLVLKTILLPSQSMSPVDRFKIYRLQRWYRIPRLVVCLNIKSRRLSISSTLQRTVNIVPGRCFFIIIGVVNTSSAGESSNCSIQKPISSGVISSRLQDISMIVSSKSLFISTKARIQFGLSNCFVPNP